VAVVGARRASRAGLAAARHLASGLARAGVVVVSGFARGIDAAAHRGALEAEGITIAVFGCGLDACYPPENADLLAELGAGGSAISEFDPGERPLPYYFPVR
jgi:DNA processing protein